MYGHARLILNGFCSKTRLLLKKSALDDYHMFEKHPIETIQVARRNQALS